MVQTNPGMRVGTLMHSDIPLKSETFLKRVSNYHLNEQEFVPWVYERMTLLY
jgi:hypothetical protein